MKRILSLVLVCVMMLSTFALTSCQIFDFALEVVEGVFEGLGYTPSRTTITKEEWDANMELKNFTITVTYDNEKAEIFRINDAIKMMDTYHVTIDGANYMIAEDGFYYPADNGWQEQASLGYLLIGSDEIQTKIYECLKYNEERGCYEGIYKESDSNISILFEFKNGKMVYGELSSENVKLVVTHIGTTNFDLPAFKLATEN